MMWRYYEPERTHELRLHGWEASVTVDLRWTVRRIGPSPHGPTVRDAVIVAYGVGETLGDAEAQAEAVIVRGGR